jgi:excisionase family DNA binding protein
MEPRTPNLHDYPELMTVAETAEYLRIALSTCYLLTNSTVHQRALPAVKVGGRTFILRERLADYLALGTS